MKQGGFSVKNLKLQADRAVLVSDGGGCVCVGVGYILFMPESIEDVGEGQTTAMSDKK